MALEYLLDLVLREIAWFQDPADHSAAACLLVTKYFEYHYVCIYIYIFNSAINVFITGPQYAIFDFVPELLVALNALPLKFLGKQIKSPQNYICIYMYIYTNKLYLLFYISATASWRLELSPDNSTVWALATYHTGCLSGTQFNCNKG